MYEASLPGELSGGVSLWAAIARALVAELRILFMDEPFGTVDQILCRRMRIEPRPIWAETGASALLIIQKNYEAIFLADRMAGMQAWPGRIVERLKSLSPVPA